MTIQIKKRVSLDFLGEEYKDSYLVFSAIPLKDYEALIEQSQQLTEDNVASMKFIKEQITKRFIEGKVAQEGKLVEITADNLLELPGEVFLQAMQQLTGTPSPKD